MSRYRLKGEKTSHDKKCVSERRYIQNQIRWLTENEASNQNWWSCSSSLRCLNDASLPRRSSSFVMNASSRTVNTRCRWRDGDRGLRDLAVQNVHKWASEMDFASSFSSVSEKTEATSRRMFPVPRAEAFAWKQMNIPSTHRVMTVVAVTTETGHYSTSTLDESWLLIRYVVDELYMVVGRFDECAISLEIEIHSVFIHPLVDWLDHVEF